VRRVPLFAALLLLLGLSTAFAASFATESEDIASFTTQVSISVPTTQPPAPPRTFFLQGDPTILPGILSTTAVQSNTVSRDVIKDTLEVQPQADATKYFVWQGPTVAGSPLVVGGNTRLTMEQKDEAGSRLTAGLFNCPAAAPVASTVATGCVQIGTSAVGTEPVGGFDQITVSFGNLVYTTIPVGNQLRLKVVNRDKDGVGVVISTRDFKVAWGYNPARQARLEFGL